MDATHPCAILARELRDRGPSAGMDARIAQALSLPLHPYTTEFGHSALLIPPGWEQGMVSHIYGNAAVLRRKEQYAGADIQLTVMPDRQGKFPPHCFVITCLEAHATEASLSPPDALPD